jgi:hypothetical protein
MRIALLLAGLAATAALGGCATSRPGNGAPAEAVPVASVRHTAGPRPAAQWVMRDALPTTSWLSDGERAILVEVTQNDEGVTRAETAPLELANLVVRIDTRRRRETVIAIQSALAMPLAFDLYVSPDGERFRWIPSCPVAAHGTAYERWPERAAWIALANPREAVGVLPGCR